ncbi:TetR/AcrR family transcriptional regulator [Paenibacillus solisilvae]|uniref:TetR/AcrR family transcriptional regulator n=1 Tax=Paenibacillus solisilvae TaxID=2486751 RepID=A0ABW0W4T8_9BACL
MQTKKRQIIEAAIICFSEKGYRGTSIQDIADSLGIAKGSMYFYFKSKEDLLRSICKYYMEAIVKQAQAIAESSLTPEEKLLKLVTLSYEQYEKNKGFITILMQERFDLNEEIHELIVKVRRIGLLASRSIICELYGPEAEPYACDAAVMFHAFIDGYLGFVILENKQFDLERLAGFVMNRLDELMCGMISKSSDIILGTEILEQWSASADDELSGGKSGVAALIESIHATVSKAALPANTIEEIISALQVIETEFEKAEPQPVVIKGMLSFLKSMKAAGLKKQLDKLEAYVLDLI